MQPEAQRDAAWNRAAADPAAAQLARPTPIQYAWHEQERIMFVCLDPCSWQGREYDDHSTRLTEQVGIPLFRQVLAHKVEAGLVKELGRMPSVIALGKHTGR